MDIKWDKEKCSHSGNCAKGADAVVKLKGEEYVLDTSESSEDQMKKAVANCPSGALTLSDN